MSYLSRICARATPALGNTPALRPAIRSQSPIAEVDQRVGIVDGAFESAPPQASEEGLSTVAQDGDPADVIQRKTADAFSPPGGGNVMGVVGSESQPLVTSEQPHQPAPRPGSLPGERANSEVNPAQLASDGDMVGQLSLRPLQRTSESVSPHPPGPLGESSIAAEESQRTSPATASEVFPSSLDVGAPISEGEQVIVESTPHLEPRETVSPGQPASDPSIPPHAEMEVPAGGPAGFEEKEIVIEQHQEIQHPPSPIPLEPKASQPAETIAGGTFSDLDGSPPPQLIIDQLVVEVVPPVKGSHDSSGSRGNSKPEARAAQAQPRAPVSLIGPLGHSVSSQVRFGLRHR